MTGTVVMLPGGREHHARLAFEGYRVVAVDSAAEVAGALRGTPVPVVLLGSGAGAVSALTLAAALPVHAVVAAGLSRAAEFPAVLPRCPVLVLHRDEDPKSARAYAEMLPAGRFALVNDRTAADEIVRFLQWLREPARARGGRSWPAGRTRPS
jgi:hypothetical protein